LQTRIVLLFGENSQPTEHALDVIGSLLEIDRIAADGGVTRYAAELSDGEERLGEVSDAFGHSLRAFGEAMHTAVFSSRPSALGKILGHPARVWSRGAITPTMNECVLGGCSLHESIAQSRVADSAPTTEEDLDEQPT
jgi:hypothetical protein